MALRKKKNAPVEEEVVKNENEEVEAEEICEEVNEKVEEAPVEETPVEEEHHNVEIKEEKKYFSITNAPEEIQKIFHFYGVTSDDLWSGKVDEMGLKDDELKALKEWYATLA